MAERRVVAPPAELDQVEQQAGFLDLRGGRVSAHRAARVATQQHQGGHGPRMAHCVGHRYGAALRTTEQGEALQPGGIDHRLQIRDPSIERQRCRTPVRQAASAPVVADQQAVAAELGQPRTPNGALQVELEVREEMRGAHHGRTVARRGVCEAQAVL